MGDIMNIKRCIKYLKNEREVLRNKNIQKKVEICFKNVIKIKWEERHGKRDNVNSMKYEPT